MTERAALRAVPAEPAPRPQLRPDVLPRSLPPRGINRVQAAEYIGVSTSKFDEMVKDGRMPKAKRIDGRTVWDVRALDEAFSDLPDEGAANPWDAESGDEGQDAGRNGRAKA